MLEKRVCTFSTLLFLLFSMTAAVAQPNGQRSFSWTREPGAESCIAEDDLHRKIADMLGRDPFVDSNDTVIAGGVRREGETLIATLSSKHRSEAPTSREFRTQAPDCAPLTDAVALAIVLLVERAPIPPPSEPVNPALAATPAPVFSEQSVQAKHGRRDAFIALAQAQWTLGWLPQPTTGVGLAFRYRIAERASVAAGGLWLPAASEGAQFSVGLSAARLGGCIDTVHAAPVTLVNCVYGLGGATRVQNEAGSVSDAGPHPWFAASATGAAMARWGEMWIAEAGVEGAVPFARPTYTTTSCPRVGFQAPAVTLAIFLSLGGSFL
jgi:hypothetical protein